MSVVAPTAPEVETMARDRAGKEEKLINMSHSRLSFRPSQKDKAAGIDVLCNCRAGLAIDETQLPKKLVVIGEEALPGVPGPA